MTKEMATTAVVPTAQQSITGYVVCPGKLITTFCEALIQIVSGEDVGDSSKSSEVPDQLTEKPESHRVISTTLCHQIQSVVVYSNRTYSYSSRGRCNHSWNIWLSIVLLSLHQV